MATSVTNKITIKPSQVQSFINCNVDRACVLATIFNKSFALYGIDTKLRVQHSLSQMAHESLNFTRYTENLNYSAAALMKTWASRFPNTTIAYQYARQPQKIANYVYANRLGNTAANDGWLLRGSGAIQLTGKENISAYAKNKGITDVYEAARLMRESDEYAIDSACWFLSIRVKALDEMDKDDAAKVTKLINGAFIGLDSRIELLAKAKKIFS